VPEPYAEVIGDPIGHSLSPTIHRFWLDRLGLAGAYRPVRVSIGELDHYFAERRADSNWRGCNVTAPLKQAVLPFVAEIDDDVRAMGAVNTVLPGSSGLHGKNSDVDGVAAALAEAKLGGARLVVIGGGGAARAAIRHGLAAGSPTIAILVRDPARAAPLRSLDPGTILEILPLDAAPEALSGAAAIVNASPLGMAGAPSMPATLLAALGHAAPSAIAFDMVYDPVETPFLAAARTAGLRPVDGLVMLVAQARRAFRLFFGADAPRSADAELRRRLLEKSGG